MSDLQVSADGGLAEVVFDRPSALNALSPSLLLAALDDPLALAAGQEYLSTRLRRR